MRRKNRTNKLAHFKEKRKEFRRQSIGNRDPEKFPGRKNRESGFQLQGIGPMYLEISSKGRNRRDIVDALRYCYADSVRERLLLRSFP